MARKKHHLSTGAPPCLGKSRRADTGNLPIHNAGEFVHYGAGRGLADQTGQYGPKALTRTQDVIRSQPGRHITQAHGGQCRRDGLPVAALIIRSDGVHNGGVLRPRLIAAQGLFAPDALSDAGLAGAGRTDHQADLPGFGVRAVNRQISIKVEADTIGIEKGTHQSGTVGVKFRGRIMDGNVHTRTSLHL